MSQNPRLWLVLVCVAVALLGSSAVWADIPRTLPADSEFDVLIGRIRKLVASKEWQKAEWKDEALEAQLSKVVAAVKTTTGKEFVKLPVEFKDVSAIPVPGGAGRGGLLHVANGNVDVAFANKSIFLVDGSIHISHAADCIIIARGVVEISHSNRNLILAGQHVNAGFDGMDGIRAARAGAIGDPEMAAGSIIITPGSISIAHSQGTFCSAPQMVEISHAAQVAFLASPKIDISHQQGCKEHKDFKAPISFAPPGTLPPGVFTVKQIVAPDDRTKQLVTVERNGVEYVLRPGNAIVDEVGKPIPGWTTWTVGFITDGLVLFTDGESDIAVRAP